jgi:hypothetical protein
MMQGQQQHGDNNNNMGMTMTCHKRETAGPFSFFVHSDLSPL